MRQIFSVRFFAAVGAVAALLFLLTSVFATRAVIDNVTDDDGPEPIVPHAIDLVDRIESATPAPVVLDADGLTVVDTRLVIDASRAVTVHASTPGEVHCDVTVPGACAIVADLLGEAVVWFAIVPMGTSLTTVPLPAIDTLEDGVATLVNGWQLRYAPALDRRCRDAQGVDEEFDSYREFREVFGDDFTTLFEIPEQRLTAVVCRERVPYVGACGPRACEPGVVGALDLRPGEGIAGEDDPFARHHVCRVRPDRRRRREPPLLHLRRGDRGVAQERPGARRQRGFELVDGRSHWAWLNGTVPWKVTAGTGLTPLAWWSDDERERVRVVVRIGLHAAGLGHRRRAVEHGEQADGALVLGAAQIAPAARSPTPPAAPTSAAAGT